MHYNVLTEDEVAGARVSVDEPLAAVRDAGLQFVVTSDADTP